MKIALLAALDAELQAVIDTFAGSAPRPTDELRPFDAVRFTYRRMTVLAARTGVGKAYAAMVTQRLIDRFEPDQLLVTGVAGALRPELRIGDVIVGRDCIQHDLDATALGFSRGEVPYTKLRIMHADGNLVRFALAANCGSAAVLPGRILTGDQFVGGAERQRLGPRFVELEGSVVEMEGAAIGLVATVNQLPFVIVRTVSDLADGTATSDFLSFAAVAARNSSIVARTVLDRLAAQR